MNKGQKLISIYVGLVALAVLIYLWWKNNSAATVVSPTATTPATSPNTTSTTGPVPVTANTTYVAQVQNPVTGQTSNSYYAANGTVEVPAVVIQTAQSDWGPNNFAQFLKMLPQMSASEIQSLNDLMVNAWGKGATPTAAQVSFWNAWRSKYHIEDGTVNNFMGPKRLYKSKRR